MSCTRSSKPVQSFGGDVGEEEEEDLHDIDHMVKWDVFLIQGERRTPMESTFAVVSSTKCVVAIPGVRVDKIRYQRSCCTSVSSCRAIFFLFFTVVNLIHLDS
jgi:hypothetical protein